MKEAHRVSHFVHEEARKSSHAKMRGRSDGNHDGAAGSVSTAGFTDLRTPPRARRCRDEEHSSRPRNTHSPEPPLAKAAEVRAVVP